MKRALWAVVLAAVLGAASLFPVTKPVSAAGGWACSNGRATITGHNAKAEAYYQSHGYTCTSS